MLPDLPPSMVRAAGSLLALTVAVPKRSVRWIQEATAEIAPQGRSAAHARARRIIVPAMLFLSSLIMAVAWLGHLRFKQLPFALAFLCCWLLVLPEYGLNVAAIRFGHRVYTGAQMAAFNLCSGVVCVALVSSVVLGEELTLRDCAGFALMIVSMALITMNRRSNPGDDVGSQAERKRS